MGWAVLGLAWLGLGFDCIGFDWIGLDRLGREAVSGALTRVPIRLTADAGALLPLNKHVMSHGINSTTISFMVVPRPALAWVAAAGGHIINNNQQSETNMGRKQRGIM